MADPGTGPEDPALGRPVGGRGEVALAGKRLLEFTARPLRHDASGIMAQFLILMAVILCPLLVAPWLWYRRERFRLNRCRVRIEGAALLVHHRQRQLLALDLRYATRQLTGAGDLVLSEEAGHYVALGVDPPEHGPADSADLAERRGAEALPALPGSGDELAAPERVATRPPAIRTWRAVRLAQAELARLCAAVSAVPRRQLPEAVDVWSLTQALGSVGATGRRAEAQLAQLVQADLGQARPSSLLTMLHEWALEEGPTATAARRLLGPRTPGP